MSERFWEHKTLAEMTNDEWEALCDTCGKCCLHKLEDEDSGEVYYTRVACRLLDLGTCPCSDYPNRLRQVPDCTVLTIERIAEFHWLPRSCAYRLLSEGQALPDWPPLISGNRDSVHKAGHSVCDQVIAETADLDLEDYLTDWEL